MDCTFFVTPLMSRPHHEFTVFGTVTGWFADLRRSLSRTGQLTDWTTRGVDDSHTGQFAGMVT